jgi:deoxyribodipyrimidine photo-lyase
LPISIFWFRRDLRLHDNTALIQATYGKYPVLPIFIFDTNILTKIDSRNDARVTFIHSTLASLKAELEQFETTLLTFHGTVEDTFQWIFNNYQVKAIYTNRDYEPAALARDKNIEKLAEKAGAKFYSFKDHVLFESSEVLKQDGSPFKVFTPYKKAWFTRYIQSNLPGEPAFPDIHNFMKTDPAPFPALSELGFEAYSGHIPTNTLNLDIIINYDKTRDFPA